MNNNSDVELEASDYEHVERDEIKGLSNIMNFADDVVLYLNDFEQYEEMGATFPYEGAAFIGERGTGKTTVAKYIATQSDAQFVNMNQFELDGMNAEVSVPEIYDEARNYVESEGEAVILFQDEMDKRFDIAGRSPESNDNYNDLIQEMSGIEGSNQNPGIFFIGTANNINEGIALLRDGRMKDLPFYTPNQEVRQEIMDLYLEQKDGDFDVDTEMLSYMFTDDTTPAEIEALIESSFFHAAKRSLEEGGEPQLTTEDVYEELAQRRLTDRTEDGRSQEEVETTALHEIGHYLVGREAGLNIPFVTIVPSIRSLGETHYVDENNIADLDHAQNLAAFTLGGYVAEQRNGNKPFMGVSRDLEQLDNIARRAGNVMNVNEMFQDAVRDSPAEPEEPEETTNQIDWDETEKVLGMLQELSEETGFDIPQIHGEWDVLDAVEGNQNNQSTSSTSSRRPQEEFKISAMTRANDVISQYEDQGLVDPLTDKLVEEETVFGKDLDAFIQEELDS